MSSKSNKWFALLVICFGGGIVYILPYIQYSFYDSLMEGLGLNNQQMGDLMSVLGIISSFAYLIGGVLADKFNVKWLVSVSLAVTGLAGLWFSTFPSYPQLMIIMVIYGISTILTYWPAMLKAVKLLGSDDEQGKMFGFREAGFGIFALVFTQLGTWLIFSSTKGVQGVQNIIVFYSVIYFIAAVLSFLFIPNSRQPEKAQIAGEKISLWNGIKYVVKIKSVWVIGLVIFCAYAISGAGLGRLTPYFTRVLTVDEGVVASLASLRMYLLPFIAASLGGILVDRIRSSTKFLFWAYIGMVVSLLAFVMIPGVNNMAVLAIIVGFIASFIIYAMRGTYLVPMTEAKIPNEYLGTAAGLISFIGYLPDAFMFSVFGGMLGNSPGETEFKSIFWVCIGLAVVGGILTFVLRKMLEKSKNENSI